MAGGTHVFDMIKRLKENENLKKKNYFKKTKELYKRTSRSINVDYRTATTIEELHEIRSKILAERKHEIRKSLMVLIFSILVTVTLILLLLKYL